MAMGHVILKEWHVEGKSEYFDDYVRRYTDLPYLVLLDEENGNTVPGRFLRASDLADDLGEADNADWKTISWTRTATAWSLPPAPSASAGPNTRANGTWNRRPGTARTSICA